MNSQSVALGEIFHVGSSKRVLKSQWTNEGVPFYRGREITRLATDGFVNNELFISESDYEEYATKYGVPGPGDIVITAIGTIGNSYIVQEGDRFYFKDASVLWLKKGTSVSSEFMNLWLKSPQFFDQLDKGNGATVDTLTIRRLRSVLVDLPPLSEQERIVAILDEAFAAIATATANAEKNLANARELADELRDLAVHGQLSQELDTDHSVEDLIIHVREMIEGAIAKRRRRKPRASPVDENDIPPFGLPRQWRWARLQDLTLGICDGVHKTPTYVPQGIPFVTVRNLTASTGISFEDVNYITREDHEQYIRRTHPERGDILVSKDGTIGVVRIVDTDVEFSLFVSVALVKPALRDMSPFLSIALSAPSIQRQIVPKGAALKHLYLIDLRRMWIPLPPLAEQRRISDQYELLATSVVEHVSLCEHKLILLAELKQSILRRAFTGELTADPNTADRALTEAGL